MMLSFLFPNSGSSERSIHDDETRTIAARRLTRDEMLNVAGGTSNPSEPVAVATCTTTVAVNSAGQILYSETKCESSSRKFNDVLINK